jgi:hypothetical protein
MNAKLLFPPPLIPSPEVPTDPSKKTSTLTNGKFSLILNLIPFISNYH